MQHRRLYALYMYRTLRAIFLLYQIRTNVDRKVPWISCRRHCGQATYVFTICLAGRERV